MTQMNEIRTVINVHHHVLRLIFHVAALLLKLIIMVIKWIIDYCLSCWLLNYFWYVFRSCNREPVVTLLLD